MENSILKIYVSNTDKIGNDLFYELMVLKAKDFGLTGATVYRGIMGFGPGSQHIVTEKFWELTEKLPVVIEMIDSTYKIENFYHSIEADINNLSKGCLVTIQSLEVKIQTNFRKK